MSASIVRFVGLISVWRRLASWMVRARDGANRGERRDCGAIILYGSVVPMEKQNSFCMVREGAYRERGLIDDFLDNFVMENAAIGVLGMQSL